MIIKYQGGTCNSEVIRLGNILDYYHSTGEIADSDYHAIRRNLQNGFYQYVRERIDEILD